MEGPQARILVTLPLYGGICFDRFLSSWTDLLKWSVRYNVDLVLQVISNESLLTRARNLGVAKALEYGDQFTHILFVDGDMGFSPMRLQRLLEWDKEFCGCPGPVKYIHWDKVYEAVLRGVDPQSFALRYAVNFFEGEGVKTENGFAKVKDFGCCFCLVKLSALKKMAEAYQHLRTRDMSHVNGENYVSDHLYTLFDTSNLDDGRYLECDHAFMYRWRQIGGDIWADLTSDLTHVGTYHFQGSMSEFFFGRPHVSGHVSAFDTQWGMSLPPKTEDQDGQVPCHDDQAS